MFKYGIISEVGKGKAKVHFDENEIVSDWLPMLVRKSLHDKDSWPLEVNEHVVCLMDENCNDGVILGAIYNEVDLPDENEGAGKFRKVFSDGTKIEYDKNTKELSVDVQGGKIKGTAAVKVIVTAPNIELTGNVQITGNAIVSGSLAAASMSTSGGGNITAGGNISASGEVSGGSDVKTGSISLKLHKHTGVQTGGGLSGSPQ